MTESHGHVWNVLVTDLEKLQIGSVKTSKALVCEYFMISTNQWGMELDKFAEIIGRSLGWASIICFIVVIFFLTVGYGNLGPIPALIYGSISFLASLVLFLILEILLALNLGLARKKTYIVTFLVVGLIPVGYFLADIIQENTQAVRMRNAKPLTSNERMLMNSMHLNLRVGVVNDKYPESVIRKFIRDLKKTCLFEDVGGVNQIENADVIATVNGYFRGINNGWTFKLHLPDNPGKDVYKAVYYRLHLLDRIFGVNSDENLYLDRLTVELIKASQRLIGAENISNYGAMPSTTDTKTRCKRIEENES